MTSTTTTALILSTVGDYGTALIAILGAVIAIGLAMLVFRFGFKTIKNFSNSDGAVVGDSDYDYHDNRKYAMMSDEEYSRVDPIIRNQRYSKDFEDVDDMR